MANPSSVPSAGDTLNLWDTLLRSKAPAPPAGIPFAESYEFFLNPWTAIVFGALYFCASETASRLQNGKNKISGRGWTAIVVVHNVLLAVYSAWIFISTGPLVIQAFWRGFQAGGVAGLTHVMCDSNNVLWETTDFPYYTYTFYLSKYYEVIDTVIILAKGKKVALLQSYHHTGALWTMLALYRTGNTAVWIFVVLNSFVHFAMYSYYTFTALQLPFPRILKQSLTQMQITQFLVGGTLAVAYATISLPELSKGITAAGAPDGRALGSLTRESVARAGRRCLQQTDQRAAIWLTVLYLIPLTYLFIAFFIRSYRRLGSIKPARKRE